MHRLFRNIAKSITGVSAITAFSTVIVGVIGVIMILIGGRAILAGRMTLGDFITYIFFTGLMAAPVVQIASIGTQISEAFAGLDRIRDLMQMATEDQEDASRRALGVIDGEVAFEDVSFEYNPGVLVLKDVTFRAPAGTTTALVGSSGSGKSTLISLVMAFNRPQERPGPGRRPRSRVGPAARLPLAARRGPAGQLPVRRHRRREHPLRHGPTRRSTTSSG